MSKNNIEERIKNCYPDADIIALEEIAEIKQASSVRSGKYADKPMEYYEIGLKNINYNSHEIDVKKNIKKYSIANLNYFKNQKLEIGDIVMGYRGKTDKIAVVTQNFDLPMVANNGLIRIRFAEDFHLLHSKIIINLLLSDEYQEEFKNAITLQGNQKSLPIEILKKLQIPKIEIKPGLSNEFEKKMMLKNTLAPESQNLVTLSQYIEDLCEIQVNNELYNIKNTKEKNYDYAAIMKILDKLKDNIKELEHNLKDEI